MKASRAELTQCKKRDRRMFLELVVKDIDGKAIWASGLTNELGVILDGLTGKPLETENAYTNQSKFQPHYQ